MMLSGSGSFREELGKFGVTVTVKVEVLFLEASTTHTKDFKTSKAQRSLNLVGYDTLDHRNWKCSMGGGHRSLRVGVADSGGGNCGKVTVPGYTCI